MKTTIKQFPTNKEEVSSWIILEQVPLLLGGKVEKSISFLTCQMALVLRSVKKRETKFLTAKRPIANDKVSGSTVSSVGVVTWGSLSEDFLSLSLPFENIPMVGLNHNCYYTSD